MKCDSKPLTQARAQESELKRHEKQSVMREGKGLKSSYYMSLNCSYLSLAAKPKAARCYITRAGEARITTAFLTLFLFMFAQNKYGVKKRPPPPANCLPLGGSCKSPGTECCDFCAFCQCRLFRTVCYCRMGNPRC